MDFLPINKFRNSENLHIHSSNKAGIKELTGSVSITTSITSSTKFNLINTTVNEKIKMIFSKIYSTQSISGGMLLHAGNGSSKPIANTGVSDVTEYELMHTFYTPYSGTILLVFTLAKEPSADGTLSGKVYYFY